MRTTPAALSGFAAAALLTLAACSPGGQADTVAAEAATPPEEAGYMAPPALATAVRSGAEVQLAGVATPGAEVRLASPEGARLSARAGADGRWTLSLPEPARPAMFAFSAVAGQRTLRGEGALLLTPAPGPPALLLRAGFGAQSLGAGREEPTILAVDYDASGDPAVAGAAVAGLATPGAAVRLSLDGAPAGFGQADAAGRFAVTATNRTLAPGVRRVEVETPAGRARVQIVASAPAPLGNGAYRAERVQGAWRIDWALPGGGVQTSVVFDQAEPRA